MSNIYLLANTCLIFLIFVPGCDASKKNQKNSAVDSTYTDSIAMQSDSLPPPSEPGPSPGHARIQAEPIDITDATPGKNYVIVTFRITKVEGYGASTPPLAVSDSVNVRASKSIVEGKAISLGKIVTAVISYRQFVLGEDSSPKWTLVTLD